MLGAIYLDSGTESSKKFIHKTLLPHLKAIIENKLYKDYKSQLQEIAQAKFNITPNYNIISEKGPDHTKTFETGAYLDKKLLAKGEYFCINYAGSKIGQIPFRVLWKFLK